LDIKRLAETETDDESLLRDIFDKFADDPSSPLAGIMSPASRAKGKLSRVTFNAAIRSVWNTFEASDSQAAYAILAAYLEAWRQRLKTFKCEDQLANPTLFKALLLLFPDVAQRVSDRYDKDFSVQRFSDALEPFKTSPPRTFRNPGQSHLALHEQLQKRLRQQFTIAGA